MLRNLNSRFAYIPDANIRRSKFPLNSSVKTSFNVGQVIPFYVQEVLPADTFQVKTNMVVRMQPLVTAPLDDIWLDTMYFFIPNRLVWTHWEELNGENKESAWYPQTEYNIPQLVSGSDGFEIGSIADYMGLPVNVPNLSVSALPFRAYSLIMNEWFRDENIIDPLETPTGDAQQTYYKLANAYNPAQYANGGKPFIAAKSHDYFTSALPSPQKGPDVTLSIGALSGSGIVYTGEPHENNGSRAGMTFNLYNGGSSPYYTALRAFFPAGYSSTGATVQANDSIRLQNFGSGYTTDSATQITVKDEKLTLWPNNLYASVETDGSTSVITINQLRQAIALQQLYELDARGGSRYTEILHAHFGVSSPDSRLQRPEYLGGNRIAINVNQVIQNSSSTETSPQGNVAGMSITTDSHGDFIQSFTEHGYVIGVCVARYAHTYQQGIERHWSRKSRFDFYWPLLANIGEMAIFNKEIYATGTSTDDEVFGYQEAWADYRYKPSRVTGEMRSNHNNTLDSWHFADDYDAIPRLSSGWIQEDLNNVDRALAVTSQVSNQLFADFYIKNEATRPMPVYSIPGLERI